jgi:hypothetical protein
MFQEGPVASPRQIRQGSVVIAPIVPDAGRIKPRPAVVLTPDAEIATASELAVIGVTASFREDDPQYFELPWSASGNAKTGFRKRCAAKFTLVQKFAVDLLRPTGGCLSREKFAALIDALRRFAARLP